MNTMLSTRERRHQRTREAILDASRKIIYEKGVDGLSMREIARRIEYSPAGLYDYFGSKEEIIGEVCTEGFRRLTLSLRSAPANGPADEAIAQSGVAYVDFAMRYPDFFLLMFTNAPLANLAKPDHAGGFQELVMTSPAFLELHHRVQRAVDEKIFRETADRSVFDMALMLWQNVHGVAMLGITMGRDQPEYQAHIESTIRSMVLGIAHL
jgi:AcrR family transcriptional regulator